MVIWGKKIYFWEFFELKNVKENSKISEISKIFLKRTLTPKIQIFRIFRFFSEILLTWPSNDLEPEQTESNQSEIRTQRAKKHIPIMVKSLVNTFFFCGAVLLRRNTKLG